MRLDLSDGGDGRDTGRRAQKSNIRWKGADGIPVVKLCLAFYSDEFLTRQFRAVSLGGVYMSYVSWPIEARTSRHAARPIAVVLSDVDSYEVLRAIENDLVTGATTG